MPSAIARALSDIDTISPVTSWGEVSGILGILIEVSGLRNAAVSDMLRIQTSSGSWLEGEIVGFRGDTALAMPFAPTVGVGPGSRVELDRAAGLRPSLAWLGRVVDARGRPKDVGKKGPLPLGPVRQPTRVAAPEAIERRRIGSRIATGVRVVDAFCPICRGQRMGIFASSGVGKTTLMSMLARWGEADVNVIGLIGERGKEVPEFIEDVLGEEGLKRSVVVYSTSDQPPLMRREAAYTAMAIAEYFRDQGLHVMVMMDTITRFAMAQREIGLAAGEPPTTKGYVPSCFTEISRLLERAGPGEPRKGQGDITALFTVLVEGDNHDEPVADHVRGTLDGHMVLERSIGERGRFPSVNVLRSVSRAMPGCHSPEEQGIIKASRQLLSTYEDMRELASIGAYKRGSDQIVDLSLEIAPRIEAVLAQRADDRTDPADTFARIDALLRAPQE